jgi:hypothetical protein
MPHFSTLSHKQHDFRKQGIEHQMPALFSLQTFSETFDILGRIQEDINVRTSLCKVPAVLERL